VTLTDRIDPRRIYLVSIAVSAFAALGFAFAAGFWSAFICQVLLGAGLAGTYMPGLRLLTDSLEEPTRSRAVTLYTGSYALGTALSFVIIGQLALALGWRWALGLAAIGPALAFFIVVFLFQPRTVAASVSFATLFDFRPALRNRVVMARAIAYAAHSYELFGLWSWTVAFLAFAYTLQPTSAFQINPTLVAAVLTLMLLPASFIGNEFAFRFGARRWIMSVMLISAVIAAFFGFSAGVLPTMALLALCVVYGFATAAESGALTSSVVASAEPQFRGMTMAVYSIIGFAGGSLGPLIFGIVLGTAGAQTVTGWGLAFLAMGLGALIGPIMLALFDRPDR
jgi:MFS family permease